MRCQVFRNQEWRSRKLHRPYVLLHCLLGSYILCIILSNEEEQLPWKVVVNGVADPTSRKPSGRTESLIWKSVKCKAQTLLKIYDLEVRIMTFLHILSGISLRWLWHSMNCCNICCSEKSFLAELLATNVLRPGVMVPLLPRSSIDFHCFFSFKIPRVWRHTQLSLANNSVRLEFSFAD